MPDEIKFHFQEDEKNITTENIEIIFDEELTKSNSFETPKEVSKPYIPPVPEVKTPVQPVEKWKPDDIQDNTNIPMKEQEQEWDDTHYKSRRRIRVIVKTDPNKPTTV